MKHADLRLDTVYADHDGRPLMLLSLDKFIKPKHPGGLISTWSSSERAFGVLIVRCGRRFGAMGREELAQVAEQLREELPARERHYDTHEVAVESLRLIVETWDDHEKRLRQEAARRQAADEREAAARQSRHDLIAEVSAALPEGMHATMYDHRDWAQISLKHLLALATAAAPVEAGEGAAFTPRERSLLAAGFDAAIATMRYEDGTPVDVVSVKNPYRGEPTTAEV